MYTGPQPSQKSKDCGGDIVFILLFIFIAQLHELGVTTKWVGPPSTPPENYCCRTVDQVTIGDIHSLLTTQHIGQQWMYSTKPN